MMRYPLLILLAAVTALAVFSGTSHAAGVLHSDDGSLWDLFQPVYDSFAGKDYWQSAACALVAAVAVAKKYGVPRYAWLGTDVGGALLTLLGAFGGTLGVSLADHQAMSLALAERAFGIAVTASGGYTVLKHAVVLPLLAPLAKKAPAWLQSSLRAVLWFFDGDTKVLPAPAVATGNTPPSASV